MMELQIVYGKVFKGTKVIGYVKEGDYGVIDVDSVVCTVIIDEEKLKQRG